MPSDEQLALFFTACRQAAALGNASLFLGVVTERELYSVGKEGEHLPMTPSYMRTLGALAEAHAAIRTLVAEAHEFYRNLIAEQPVENFAELKPAYATIKQEHDAIRDRLEEGSWDEKNPEGMFNLPERTPEEIEEMIRSFRRSANRYAAHGKNQRKAADRLAALGLGLPPVEESDGAA